MSKRSMALGIASVVVGVSLFWLMDSYGISQATSTTSTGNQFPTIVGNAGPFPTLLLLTAGASLLLGFGAVQMLRGRTQLDTRASRFGTASVLAGVVLSVNALMLPWWQFSYQVNGVPYCGGTFVFSLWYLQYSGPCPPFPNSTDWWYSSPSFFSHGGAVALNASYVEMVAVALGVAAALVVLRRRSRGPLSSRRASAGFLLGLAAAAANLGAALFFAGALPSALSTDNSGSASFYPYDRSFWGSTTRAGTPSATFYWGPDWNWVLVLIAAALLVMGVVVSYRSFRSGARNREAGQPTTP